MIATACAALLTLQPTTVRLDAISPDRARTLHGRVVVASLLVCKPVMTYGRPGETVIGCADLDEHVERGARLLGRRYDVEEGKRLTVGVMRVFDHPACFVGDVPVPAWVEELRR